MTEFTQRLVQGVDPLDKLTPRTARLLRGHGLTTVAQVVEAYHAVTLLDIRNFGFKSLREVEKHFLPGHHYDPRASRTVLKR